MRVITLARKPLVGSVADNVLRFGTGGLNIDACRIGTHGEKLQGGAGGLLSDIRDDTPYPEGHEFIQAEGGRWPSNVVLEHRPECRQVGTKKVKSQNPKYVTEGTGATRRMAFAHGARPLHQGIGHAGPDGLEEVSAWECHPDCPVLALDDQSGPTGAFAPVRGSEPSEVTKSVYNQRERVQGAFHDDTGGASRFFKQFGGGDSADQE